LVIAARDGDIESVRRLIESGADVNACATFEGCDTALIKAIETGHMEIVALLLASGADVNKPANMPLVVAASHHRFEIARILVENGAIISRDYPAYDKLRQSIKSSGDSQLYDLLFSD